MDGYDRPKAEGYTHKRKYLTLQISLIVIKIKG